MQNNFNLFILGISKFLLSIVFALFSLTCIFLVGFFLLHYTDSLMATVCGEFILFVSLYLLKKKLIASKQPK